MAEQISNYELENWISKLKSVPVEVLISEDSSPAWEMDKFWVVRLENNKFATIYESGCSCYDSSQAKIEILPTRDAAIQQYNKWKKNNEDMRRMMES